MATSSPTLILPPAYSLLGLSYKPVLPSANRRYSRERKVPNPNCPLATIPANTKARTFTDDHPAGPLPDGWAEHIHPEGDTYWYQSGKGLMTSLDPRDARVNDCLVRASDEILPVPSSQSDTEIFIDLDFSNPARVTVLYYMVNHRSRQIFWKSDIDFDHVRMSS